MIINLNGDVQRTQGFLGLQPSRHDVIIPYVVSVDRLPQMIKLFFPGELNFLYLLTLAT